MESQFNKKRTRSHSSNLNLLPPSSDELELDDRIISPTSVQNLPSPVNMLSNNELEQDETSSWGHFVDLGISHIVSVIFKKRTFSTSIPSALPLITEEKPSEEEQDDENSTRMSL